MPIWNCATTLGDLESLLGEGRAQLGRRVARRPLDFARAVAKLGIARGLSGFERYAYLERNGQSKIAVPLGRIGTGERGRAQLIDDIGPWLDRLQRQVRDGDAPTRLQVVEAALADAVFVVPAGAAPAASPRLGIALAGGEGSPRIEKVAPDSLAARSGLRTGDRIQRVAGVAIHGADDIAAAVREQPPGTILPIVVQRDAREIEVLVRFPPRAP